VCSQLETVKCKSDFVFWVLISDDIDGITKTILESTYLGSVDIPFTTVYLNGNVSGIFEVNVPPVNLGYKYQQAGTDEFSLPFAPVRVGPEAMNPAHAGARTFMYVHGSRARRMVSHPLTFRFPATCSYRWTHLSPSLRSLLPQRPEARICGC